MMSEQAALERRSDDMTQPETSQSHDSDDEPMVYVTSKDYATIARQTRDRLIAEGADPDSVIFQSDLPKIIQRQEGESRTDFAKRFSATMNDMIKRGVLILNDTCTADVVASGFRFRGGRRFDLGPRSGATKREFREFSKWFSDNANTGEVPEVPEKWLKFEMHAEERSGS
ncbi:uncharacterized protein BHQ10_008328 [Talaromyces amestolkiae]|uniref:Uncharacterized protein n=1 Tax=Talaromyces amestolkiae TaxID=1196081 RepID=A0A364L928_TALAM|nr:uncharacterized protein BHQ10_008328 [Talaromyces amestolkiae]RAO72316.1 hypothetical protein BHQ10_008328 [Talaromyces amestolkiae]